MIIRLTSKEDNFLDVSTLDQCPHRPESVTGLCVLLAGQMKQTLSLCRLPAQHGTKHTSHKAHKLISIMT